MKYRVHLIYTKSGRRVVVVDADSEREASEVAAINFRSEGPETEGDWGTVAYSSPAELVHPVPEGDKT